MYVATFKAVFIETWRPPPSRPGFVMHGCVGAIVPFCEKFFIKKKAKQC